MLSLLCCLLCSVMLTYAQPVRTATLSSGTTFTAADVNTSGAWVARHGMSSSKYQDEFNKWTGKGYRLILVDGYSIGSKTRYAAIWEKKSGGAWKAHHGMTGSQYQSKFNEYTGKGYRLTLVDGYVVSGKTYYTAIWEKKSGGVWKAHHGMTSSQYQSKFDEYTGKGYRLTLVSGYNVGSKDYYAAIWEKKSGNALRARHRLSSKNYQAEFDNMTYQSYRPRWVSGYSNGSAGRYAAIWESTGAWKSSDIKHIDKTIKAFMKKHDIPGISVAIAKDGKLIFAKGYGYADKSKGELLKLSDKVFGSGAILGTTYGSVPYSNREKAITVQQLLEHTAGGNTWNNKGDDGSGAPMFQQTFYDHKKLIGWVLDERNPSATPGTTYDYSNFGYSVLGRVIEKKSGQSYANYVKNNVLKKCGIKDMHIGGNTKAQKRSNEVVYYGGSAYDFNIKRMDAHGAWIASAVDLTRFAVHVDGFNTEPDILNSSTINTMTTGSSVNSNYAKGWAVNGSNNWWHAGSISGNGAILVRTSGGDCWAFLMNKTWEGEADGMMWDVVNGINSIPSINLF